MIKNILVCTDGSMYGDVASEFGLFLAQKLHARLRGLHVLDSRMLEGPLMADISGWLGAQPYGAQVEHFRRIQEEKGQAVIEAFQKRCADAGMEAEVTILTGHPVSVILQEEGKSELIIIGRKGVHSHWLKDLPGSVADRVIRDSSTPCMITPEVFSPIGKILIGYDGSGHSGKALHEAIELSLALDAELIILTVDEQNKITEAETVSAAGLSLAQAHGCRAVNMLMDGRPSEALLTVAIEQEVDLIVVGAYGHSRIRALILGSAPTYLTTHSACPVLTVK